MRSHDITKEAQERQRDMRHEMRWDEMKGHEIAT